MCVCVCEVGGVGESHTIERQQGGLCITPPLETNKAISTLLDKGLMFVQGSESPTRWTGQREKIEHETRRGVDQGSPAKAITHLKALASEEAVTESSMSRT